LLSAALLYYLSVRLYSREKFL